MKYENMMPGIFISRPNRFVAKAEIKGKEEICHVKNTGRLKELLYPGVPIWVQHRDDPARKTRYSLILAEKTLENGKKILVNLDSQAPNQAAEEWVKSGADGLFKDVSLVKRETRFGNSRFDLYIEADGKRIFMEVKGVTLEEGGIARFPDAPTLRGLKHVEELAACREAGYEAYLLFVIQMKGVRLFEPNENPHPAFGEALRAAAGMGVHILAYDCLVTEDSMTIGKPIKIRLSL
ncbi:DNA/RNA nuclease SfsA [Qiania dongpingensis]|uniref:Sugar fermentation stimulation protein homolog n=1 Tax=Qiania dongpingensis TaxID=2763669 RepID=A0A7G9G7G0_9FIRM|nr:DNA/RNA nuclease SfsA [Qiania dongpingensis]QNM06742.1 DNA/RNA nuclease SfsA [Qiania dongpingensis]